MRSLVSTFVVAALTLASVAQAQSTVGIPWQTDLEAAKQTAAKEGKLLLVHVWTPSCGPCRLLDQTVFNQPNVAAVVTQSYVPVKLNANESPATAQALGITRVPTDVVLTPQGQVVEKFVSQQTPMAYIAQVNQVATKYNDAAGRQFATVANTQPSNVPVNPAYASLNGLTPAAGTLSTPVVAEAPGIANPYAAAAAPVAPTTTPGMNPGIVATAPLAAAPTAPARVNNPYTPIAAAPVAPVQAPVAPQAQLQQPVAPQVAATTQPQQQQPQAPVVQLPAGSPPLGFEGYCPVTMKNEWKWQPGDVQWGAIHRGRTYLFASQAAQQEFLKPGMADVYAPVMGGVDPVLAIDGQQQVPGQRQFAVEYGGQFYMFSSEESLSRFWTAADRYASGVRQAMNASVVAPQSNLR